MTFRSILLTFAFVSALSVPAFAQVPIVRIYEDQSYSPFFHCGPQGTLHEFIVVLHNVDDVVSAVDFSIQYPASMIFLGDQLPDGGYFNNEVILLGSSPTGVAVAWHSCCMTDASQGLVVLRPLIMWTGNCDCAQALVVGGYTPLGKTQPSFVRFADFTEHPALGSASPWIQCSVPVEPTTWGKVKSLYR